MRFTVIGTRCGGGESTDPVELTLDAMNADHAEALAAAEWGLKVDRVRIAAPAVSMPIAPAAEAALWPPAAPSAAVVPARPLAASVHAAGAATAQAAAACWGTLGQYGAPTNDRAKFLGLVAISLGSAGLLFCWIPIVGLISTPLCLAGGAAGVMGVLAARAQSRSNRDGLDRMMLPAGGAALSTLALGFAVLFALGPTEEAMAGGGSRVRIQAVVKESAPEPKARNLSIVAGTTTGTGSLFGPKTAATVPVSSEPPAPVRLGDVEVSVVSAAVENVQLTGEMGRPQGMWPEPVLVVRVLVRNVGTNARVAYRTLAGEGRDLEARGATLTDETGRRRPRADFGVHMAPLGRVTAETIFPGKSLTDTLAFEAPPAGGAIGALRLTLQGKCFGGSGTVEMVIPGGMVER